MEVDYTFALRLKELRERRGMMQKELGERAAINPNRISNWELGLRRPPIDAVRALCVALNCSADELLGLRHADLNQDEHYCLIHYRLLDDSGRDTVRAVIDSQLRRLAAGSDFDG